jgi:tetratricopeptide (TPR) repeat protein
MFIRVLFFCILFFGTHSKGFSATVFNFNDQCLKAQKLIFELKFDEAEKILVSESQLNSENIAVPWLSETIIFLKLFISEDADLYEKSSKEWSNLISKTQKFTFNNAWYRHILSDMFIHRALIRLKFNENFSAGTDVQTAYKYLKDNKKMFPSFLADNKNYGLLCCAFSSVPSKYQWLAKIIGFQGDMQTGLTEIELYLKSDQTYKEHACLRLEAAFIYGMIQHHLNKNTAKAWLTIEPFTRNYKTNLLENYMRATIAGYNGMNDDMVDILKNKPAYSESYPFYYMDFMLGLAKMRRLDADAELYFKIFTVKYKGKNYVKSAYRNLSWLCQLKNDDKGAKTYYSLATKKGIAVIEEDKQAEREAVENLLWPADVLKARLLFDGKYYDLALKTLKSINDKHLNHIRFKLEVIYRKARIYHENGNLDDAIVLYKNAIEQGRKQAYYYAAYSALQLGYIYEKQNKLDLAKTYFNQAKNDFSDNKEYANSIEQKAKAGLKRIGK